ncbi:hypothetical protein SC020_15370 [Legionella pneumophila serogroup 1]
MKISNFKATGLLRRYAPRNDGPKNRTVQRYNRYYILGQLPKKCIIAHFFIC